MIEIVNLTKSYLTTTGREYVFKDLSLKIPEGRNVALIGRNGAGKSTLLRLIGGLDTPDKGEIRTDKTVSWPIGLSGGFQGSLTARQNVKFLARVYGSDRDDIRKKLDFVEEFAEIGNYFDRPVKTFSSGMRARVAFGLSLAFDFDYYLIDEAMSVGDAHFRAKAEAVFKEKIGHSNIILVSHGMGQVRNMCDYVLVIQKGIVETFENIEEGIARYQATC